MTTTDDLIERNSAFAAGQFSTDLTANAWGHITVVCCVDPRVDPAAVLGLAVGEASVVRNFGGRVTPSVVRCLAMLATVRQGHSYDVSTAHTLALFHHTDCRMIDLVRMPELLAEYFEIPVGQLDTKSVPDPYGSVRVDVEVVRAHVHAVNTVVSGLVYDVRTGQVELVVKPARLDAG